MMRLGISSLTIGLLISIAGTGAVRGESASAGPDFKEVYDLIRQHLTEISDTELNRLAVQGLVAGLAPKVSLVGNEIPPGAPGEALLVSKSSLFDGQIGYVRVRRVGDGLEKAIREACQQLAATNKLNGVVLDLRYATGSDYAAAAAAADLFIRKEQPLLDWGQGLVRSKENVDAISVPVAVLVNRLTSGSAEALAAVLREAGAGLLLGNRTAGQAMIAQDLPLKDGERLRIATAPIQLGDGSVLSDQGIKPDITVEVRPEDEGAYYGDAFKELPKSSLATAAGLSGTNQVSGTNRTRRARFNEAELVRERRDGFNPDSDSTGSGGNEPDKPVVHDPVLARALDVLKGLTLIRQSHS